LKLVSEHTHTHTHTHTQVSLVKEHSYKILHMLCWFF